MCGQHADFCHFSVKENQKRKPVNTITTAIVPTGPAPTPDANVTIATERKVTRISGSKLDTNTVFVLSLVHEHQPSSADWHEQVLLV